jgi:hypothetical protein
LRGIDASVSSTPQEKAQILISGDIATVNQSKVLLNPDSRVVFRESGDIHLLEQYAECPRGVVTGDGDQWVRKFWEIRSNNQDWRWFQGSISATTEFSGRDKIIDWSKNGEGMLRPGRENLALGRWGVSVSLMGGLPVTFYSGELYDQTTASIVPKDRTNLGAIYMYCKSDEFHQNIREIDQKLNVTPATLLKVPFDISRWKSAAEDAFPDVISKFYSDDLDQWIFHGHPKPSTAPLQVAIARLVGYRWPAESDTEMELSDEARNWISRCAELDDLTDDDGIVCLPAVRGEPAAIDRLRALLARAFGADWSAAREAQLLTDAGCDGMPLVQWLRDKFFEQHIARFGKRPFIWHVWDGHKEGFSALINYHQLTREKLTTLIHLYLGDWITQQKRAVDAGNADAVLKLAKAEALKVKLEAILTGEPPYDIFVRWKPEHQLPLGWEPDINDGVRMNIRPFVAAEVLRIPRAKLGIKWEADRGKDVPSAPWYKLGPQYGEPEGTRINDHHTTLAEKQAARAKAGSK